MNSGGANGKSPKNIVHQNATEVGTRNVTIFAHTRLLWARAFCSNTKKSLSDVAKKMN